MAHNHGNNEISDTKNLRIAFFLNLLFTIVEIVGGILTNSVAIFSDAIHDLGDSLSLGLAWYFQKLSQKDRDTKFSYGYRRYSVLGALINTIVLIIGCIFILWETIPRLIHPEEVNPQGMIYLAILGVIVNGVAVFRLKKGSSLNEKVVALHLLEDVLGWVAVLIGAIIMLFWDVPIIDPLLSLLIALYILFNIYRNMKSALGVILQRIPPNVKIEEIEDYLSNKKGIDYFADLHVWSLDGNYNIMTLNIALDSSVSLEDLPKFIDTIHAEMKEYNVHHCTIQIIAL